MYILVCFTGIPVYGCLNVWKAVVFTVSFVIFSASDALCSVSSQPPSSASSSSSLASLLPSSFGRDCCRSFLGGGGPFFSPPHPSICLGGTSTPVFSYSPLPPPPPPLGMFGPSMGLHPSLVTPSMVMGLQPGGGFASDALSLSASKCLGLSLKCKLNPLDVGKTFTSLVVECVGRPVRIGSPEG